MNIRFQISLLVAMLALFINGCSPDISGRNDQPPDAGSGDFSIFVSVGDSLTAGYADGALYRDGQLNSFPAIMAQQFALTGGGDFGQPLMPDGATGSLNFGGVDLSRPDRLMIAASGVDNPPVLPETINTVQSTDIQTRIAGAGTFRNMGVPGAKSFHLSVNTYGTLSLAAIGGGLASPYFARFASADNTTVLIDAASLVSSFFTLWIGANDILGYATDGGSTNNAVPPYGTATEDITDPAVFAGSFDFAVASLNNAGNIGLLVNVPDVAVIPYFTTAPYNPVPMDQTTADAVNNNYDTTYNAGLAAAAGAMLITPEEQAQRTIRFEAIEDNALVIEDESLTVITLPPAFGGTTLPNIRQATANDFVLLPALSKIGTLADPMDLNSVWGVGEPMADGDVLTEFEHGQIETARAAYNTTIKDAADMNSDLLFLDAAALLEELGTTGILYGSGGVSSAFIQGGAFSADGIHLTARGNAVIANEIFKVINEGLDAYIPPVDPSDYTTVFYQ